MDAEISVRLANPNPDRGVRWHVTLEGDDRWDLEPNHRHAQASGKAVTEMTFGCDASRVQSMLGGGARVGPFFGVDGAWRGHSNPRIPPPVLSNFDLGDLPEPDVDQVLKTGAKAGHARVASASLPLPDGPMTLECWVRPDRFSDRVGVVTKTEGSEYGIFASNGRPEFYIHVGGGYRVAAAPEQFRLKTRSWSHVAGVYDGKSIRLFINGKEVGRSSASGTRLTNMLPLVVGGDVAEDGSMMSPFEGRLEEVRLSKVARYTQDFAHRFGMHRTMTRCCCCLVMWRWWGRSCPIVQARRSTPRSRGRSSLPLRTAKADGRAANNSRTTRPSTSVRRKSRPACR